MTARMSSALAGFGVRPICEADFTSCRDKMMQPKAYSLDKVVAQLNIDHYRKLLLTDLEAIKRRTIELLLAAENAKLVELQKS
jgi:hypothetical protein